MCTYSTVIGMKTANYFTKVLPTSFIATKSQPWHEGLIAWGKYKNSHPPFVLREIATAQIRQQDSGDAKAPSAGPAGSDQDTDVAASSEEKLLKSSLTICIPATHSFISNDTSIKWTGIPNSCLLQLFLYETLWRVLWSYILTSKTVGLLGWNPVFLMEVSPHWSQAAEFTVGISACWNNSASPNES